MIARATNFERSAYVEYLPEKQPYHGDIDPWEESPGVAARKSMRKFNRPLIGRPEYERRANKWYRAHPVFLPANCGDAWKPLLSDVHCLI